MSTTASFNRQTLKKTVRRSAGDGRVYIYPTRLATAPAARRREVAAQLGIAIRYFETMVGQRRAAFDPEALIALFGDPKLARGLVAAFARYYRYRPLKPGEVVPPAVADGLYEKRLATPAALRANLFRAINTAPQHGYTLEADRADVLSHFGADLGLDPEQVADLLWLDSAENWLLTRLAQPQAADLIAVYDFLAIETVLRYASQLDLEFRSPVPPAVGRDLRLLLGHYDLRCAVGEERADQPWRVTVHGRADARGSWARHGIRLVRLLVRLLAAHPGCLLGGEAQIELTASAVLRLDEPLLAALSGDTAPSYGDTAPSYGDGVPVLTPAACADLRAAGLPRGWALRLDPEPLVYPGGVVAPLVMATRRDRRIYVLAVNSVAHLDRLERGLAALRGRAEWLLLVAPEVAASGRTLPGPHLVYTPGEPLDLKAVVALLVAHWEQPLPVALPTDAPSTVGLLLGRVRREGLVPVAAVREALGDEPAQGPLPGGRGVEYIPAVGLCSAGFLARVRELIDEQLEFFAGRLVTLPQLTGTLALNLAGAEAVGLPALERLIAALPDYVIVPRKLFDPYVRPLAHVTAGRGAATAAALGRAA
ncbi:MAG: DUF790 family protein [Chloroflexota bacterium]|nr:DUF790 family protein [Chloroflexota bacterium]